MPDGRALVVKEVSVLVIDDDAGIRRRLASVMVRDGYTVLTACDGREALEFLREIRPRVILVDLEMPNMDGAAFREAQRRDRTWLAIPTVVMTGTPEEALLDPAVAHTLQKPVRMDELLAIVQRHAGAAR